MNLSKGHAKAVIAEYLKPGENLYYSTLYLGDYQQNTRLLILFLEHLYALLYSSTEVAIRQKKIQWWIDEWLTTVHSSNPCHPFTRAIEEQSLSKKLEVPVQNYLQLLLETSQQFNLNAENFDKMVRYETRIIHLVSDFSGDIDVSHTVIEIIVRYRLLKNLEKDRLYQYSLFQDLPKYYSLVDENKEELFLKTFLQQTAIKLQQVHGKMRGRELPLYLINQLFLIQKEIKKLKHSPQRFYNPKPILNPLQQFFCVYPLRHRKYF